MEGPGYLSRSSTSKQPRAPMQSLTSDRGPLYAFRDQAAEHAAVEGVDILSNGDQLPLHIFEWDQRIEKGAGTVRNDEFGDGSASILVGTHTPQVRVIVAPREVPAPRFVNGFTYLFERFGVPSAFIAETLQRVSQSFGASKDEFGAEYIWFHVLSKDVTIEPVVGACLEDPLPPARYAAQCGAASSSPEVPTEDFTRGNYTWLKPGFVLKIEPDHMLPPPQSRSTSDSSGVPTLTNSEAVQAKSVTLLCFGAPETVVRFHGLTKTASSNELLEDPFIPLEIAFDEIHKQMDRVGWHVADTFGAIEYDILGEASKPVKAGKKVNFARLHNLMKHVIYLQENCTAALSTLESLCKSHEKYISNSRTSLQLHTHQALEYRKTMFQSTERKLSSLDRRMANILQLSFHLVTQKDSRIMQSEALSMKMIAVVTLIFVPVATVAAIFGTQLIRLDDERPFHMSVSQDFWLLWVIAVPLTVVVIVIWRVWYREERAQLNDEGLDGEEEDCGYMGWKSLLRKYNRYSRTRRMERRNRRAEEERREPLDFEMGLRDNDMYSVVS